MRYEKVFRNARWIILCRVIQSLLQLVVGMLCARYLGPAGYGLIGYAASVMSFALPLMRLGFNATLVKTLVEDPEGQDQIMGTALGMNLLSALVCMAGVTAFAALTNPGNGEVVLVCGLYSLSLIFSALEMVQYWFQHRLMSGYCAVVMLVSYAAASAYRILLLIRGAQVHWFALTNSVDHGLISLSLIWIYRRKGGGFSFSLARGRKMLAASRYYMISAVMVVVIQSTDHIMLTSMTGTEENGLYSAAVTCATMTQFVYLAIIDSFRPVVLEERGRNETLFERSMSRLYGIIILLALAQSVVFTAFGRWIITLFYGSAFAGAVPVFRLLNWYFVFSCMGTVRNVWILAEGLEKYLLPVNFWGAIVNVAMNWLLIPRFGAVGAAGASLLTQFTNNFVMGFVIRPLRRNNLLMLRGISPEFVRRELGNLANAVKKRNEEETL